MTKPSRSASKGRLAFSGASFRVERAFMAQKPSTASGVITASVPPASMASAVPSPMMRADSPMAWVPVAQAVTTERFGPLAPNRMETWPEASSMIMPGMKKGDMRRGPRSSSSLVLTLQERQAADAGST